jgi:hypothetical protein
MGTKKFLNDGFRTLAAASLGDGAQARLYGEALANSLSGEQPLVVAEIMEVLARRYPNSFTSVVSKRLGGRASSTRALPKSKGVPAPS